MDREHGIVEKELMNGRVVREMTEARKEARRAPRAANPIGTATRIKEAREKGKGKGKSETRYCYDCGEQGHIGHSSGPTALMKKMIKHYCGRASLKEGTLKNSRAWRRPTRKDSGVGLRRAESPGGEGELTHDQHSTTSLKTMKVIKRPND